MRLRLSNRAIDILIDHATEGYGMAYKREVGGHLLGFKDRNGFFYVKKLVPYKTPFGSRTACDPNPYYFGKKGDRLEKITRLRWIGAYHSHVEIKGMASTKQSGEDRTVHFFSQRPAEIIVRVTNYPMNWPKICLSYERYGCWYDICGYVKD